MNMFSEKTKFTVQALHTDMEFMYESTDPGNLFF